MNDSLRQAGRLPHVTRRSFLAGSAAAATGLWLAGRGTPLLGQEEGDRPRQDEGKMGRGTLLAMG
jgi:hypothetical protein